MPAGPALARDDQGHLAGGLVDHLVAEHRRALGAAGLRGAPVVGVQDQLGVVVVLLRGGEDLVGGGDLVRVQHPLAVEAQGGGPAGHLAVAVGVADLQVGAVDGLQVVGPGGHQDAHQDVVVGVRRVAGRLLADHQRLHVDRGHEVGRAEDDGLQPRRGRGDRVDVHQALGVLDLGLDADPADLEAHRLLDLGQQQVQRLDLLGVLHLGQHDAVQVRARALDHRDHVPVGPVRGPVVDPDDAGLAAPVAVVQRVDDGVPGALLDQRRAGVLQVQEDLVGGQALGLLQEARVAAGDGQAGAAGRRRLVAGAGRRAAGRSSCRSCHPSLWPRPGQLAGPATAGACGRAGSRPRSGR